MIDREMLDVHLCTLPPKDFSGLAPLAPNASRGTRLLRKLRKITMVNPKNFKCKIFFSNRSTILAEQRRHISSPYNYIIHPYSTLCSVYEITFFVIWMIKMLADPILVLKADGNRFVDAMDKMVLPFIQFVLIVSFFFVGYPDAEAGEIVIDPKLVVKRYLKTFFVFDLVSTDTIRALTILSLTAVGVAPTWRIAKIMHYAHVLCLYTRMGSVLRYLDDIMNMLRLSPKVRKTVIVFVKTYMCIHLLSCLMYFVPCMVYTTKFPADSWLVMAKIHPPVHPATAVVYRECLLMTMCFFFGTSTGQYYIDQPSEQFCFGCVSFFGRLYVLFLLADVLRMFGVVGVSESNYESSFVQLREYMKVNDLPPSLRSRMVSYYEHKLQKRYFNEAEIRNNLSGNLRKELFLFSARFVIDRCHIFNLLPQAQIATLISMMRTETFASGNIIFKAGQYIDDVYFISAGSVAIFNKDGMELCHLTDGDTIGLVSKLTNQKNYTAVTLETTEFFAIRFKDLDEFLEPYPEAVRYMSELSKERLAEYSQLEADAKVVGKNCLVDLRTGRLLERRKVRMHIH